MANFTYTKPAGDWTDGVDTIDETDLESFEQKMFKSLNAAEGGSWAPTSEIELLGEGVRLGKARLTTGSAVANIAGLQALTGMNDGQLVHVKKVGLFVYEDPDSTLEALPLVVQPASGTGRWFLTTHSLKNQTVYNNFVNYGDGTTYNVAAYTNTTIISETVPTLPGDKVDVVYDFTIEFQDDVLVLARVNGVAQTANNSAVFNTSDGTQKVYASARGFGDASGGTTTTVELRVQNTGGTIIDLYPRNRRVTVVRG